MTKRVKFTVPGRPVPKARMTQKTKWTDRAKRTLDYQKKVAWHVKSAAQGTQFEFDEEVKAIFRIYLAGC